MGALDDFDGVPLEDLVFDSIDWTLTTEHVEQRDRRKGTTEIAPKVEWATQACNDPRRLVGRTTSAVVVLGYSSAAGCVLRVVLRPVRHASIGDWYGLTAHAAGAGARRAYEEAT